MQVSTIDTVPGAGSGKDAAKPSQAASDAFAILLQNALTQNSGTSNLRASSTSELANLFSTPAEPYTDIETDTVRAEDVTGDETAADSEAQPAPAGDSQHNDDVPPPNSPVITVNSPESTLAALTSTTEAQISQSRARGGMTTAQQSTPSAPQSVPPNGQNSPDTAIPVGEVAKTSQPVSSPQPGTATNGANTGQTSAQVTETPQNIVSRPSNTLAASAAVTAQTGSNAKSADAAVTVASAPTAQNVNAPLSGNATDKPATAANLSGQESFKDPGTTTARNGESNGNLLLNNTSAAKAASQYNVQPGRIAQPGVSTPQTATSEIVGATPVQQTTVATAQNIGQPALSAETSRRTAIPTRVSTASPVSDSSSVTAGTAQAGTPSTAAAARAAAPAPTRPTPAPANLNEQISVKIQKAVSQGIDRIRIQLKPAELGRLDIQLEVSQDGRVAAIVNADRPETLDMLRRDARGLQQALQDAGLQMDSNNLSFNLGNGNAPSEEQRAGGNRTTAGDEQTTVAGKSEDSESAEPRRQSSVSMIDVEV